MFVCTCVEQNIKRSTSSFILSKWMEFYTEFYTEQAGWSFILSKFYTEQAGWRRRKPQFTFHCCLLFEVFQIASIF